MIGWNPLQHSWEYLTGVYLGPYQKSMTNLICKDSYGLLWFIINVWEGPKTIFVSGLFTQHYSVFKDWLVSENFDMRGKRWAYPSASLSFASYVTCKFFERVVWTLHVHYMFFKIGVL